MKKEITNLEQFKLNDLPLDQETDLELNLATPWVQSILDEMQENAELDSESPSTLDFQLSLKKQTRVNLGEHIIMVGTINSRYQTPCVRCLENGHQKIETEFKICLLAKHYEKDEAYQELDSLFIKEEEYQLYYYEKGSFSLKSLLSEQVFMSVEYLPLHDENCLGLCQICGSNQNLKTCAHDKPLN